jgi:hypothetical protein
MILKHQLLSVAAVFSQLGGNQVSYACHFDFSIEILTSIFELTES